LIEQGQRLEEDLPDYVERLQRRLNTNPTVREWVQGNANRGGANPQALFSGALSYGKSIVSGIVSLVMAIVLTLYLLVDGPRLYHWGLGILSPDTRERVERVQPEFSRVVSGYVLGQCITSLLFGVFTFIVLSATGVPEPLFLAVLAALLDAIPLIGATAATIPAVLLALTVSFPTAVLVLVLYVVYQQFENYVIAPRVYGKTLQISSLAVLIAVLVGGTLLGVIGVLLALPIAAALPAVARAWSDDPRVSRLVPDVSTPTSEGS
jgi:predicted PurR-regulated permease PerM